MERKERRQRKVSNPLDSKLFIFISNGFPRKSIKVNIMKLMVLILGEIEELSEEDQTLKSELEMLVERLSVRLED
jgi:hypothetical protein